VGHGGAVQRPTGQRVWGQQHPCVGRAVCGVGASSNNTGHMCERRCLAAPRAAHQLCTVTHPDQRRDAHACGVLYLFFLVLKLSTRAPGASRVFFDTNQRHGRAGWPADADAAGLRPQRRALPLRPPAEAAAQALPERTGEGHPRPTSLLTSA
jgi:hypothetical protein